MAPMSFKVGDRVMTTVGPGIIAGHNRNHGRRFWFVWLGAVRPDAYLPAEVDDAVDIHYGLIGNRSERRGKGVYDLDISFDGPSPPRVDLRCCSCHEPCPYAAPNLDGGRYQCYSCRSTYVRVPPVHAARA